MKSVVAPRIWRSEFPVSIMSRTIARPARIDWRFAVGRVRDGRSRVGAVGKRYFVDGLDIQLRIDLRIVQLQRFLGRLHGIRRQLHRNWWVLLLVRGHQRRQRILILRPHLFAGAAPR